MSPSQTLAAATHRRMFLRGFGVSLALPWLESLARPTRKLEAAAPGSADDKPPVRMAFVFFANGAIMPAWTPQGAGDDYQLSETLQALSAHRSEFNVITGLAQDNGRAKGDGPGDHARCAASYLTGAHPYKTSGADIRVGVSVDQVAADRIGSKTPLPSLELGIESGRNAGSCDSGYSCAYSSNISWKSATTPMAKEIQPRLVFERLFGDEDTVKQQAGRQRRDFYRKSILDVVAADADRLRKRLGATDRRKLDEYFTSVRELEQRISRADSGSSAPVDFAKPERPADLTEHIRLMYDLLAVAFQTDTTRVGTFMTGNAGSNRSYSMVGVREGHHQLSHHRNAQDKVSKIKKIDRYLADQFGYFLAKLRSIQEGERTLLDNCLIMYGSGLSDGNRHDHANLPVVLAGRGGGAVSTGRHLKLNGETPLNNLFLTMLDTVGANVDKLGDSSGRLKL